jgi:hypothetical protein
MRRVLVFAAAVLSLAACSDTTITGSGGLDAPTNLTYQLLPSGDPSEPEGIQLRWDPTNDSRVANYVVYSRGSDGQWNRRAETTTAAFVDLGVPDLEYYVTAEADDGTESDASNTVTVDLAHQLQTPSALGSVSLNQAIALSWAANARTAPGSDFSYYRVYSSDCGSDWVLEGTTVSEDFIASGLPNGVKRCFAVSAISSTGSESEWTPTHDDTPRFDSRNVLVFTSQDSLSESGFSFDDGSGELGVVLPGNRADLDFRLDRHGDGSLWMVPIYDGTTVAFYSDQPIADLTSIDYGLVTGFEGTPIEAVAGYGYVFRIELSDGVHYAGLRVTQTAPTYMIFDWSYQTDPGNPELRRQGGTRRSSATHWKAGGAE